MAEILDLVHDIIVEKIPFNRLLGIQVRKLTNERVELQFAMRPELIGYYLRGALHGGVISATLDLTGGVIAFLSALKRLDEPIEQKLERFQKLGTIDLRVDYLQPGVG